MSSEIPTHNITGNPEIKEPKGFQKEVFHSGPTANGKELAYTAEFVEFTKEHPRMMFEVKQVIEKWFQSNSESSPGDLIESENYNITFLDIQEVTASRFYFRVTPKQGRGDFFLKINTYVKGNHEQGVSELLLLRQLEEDLKGFKTELDFKVRTLKYFLGYKDAHRAYFVAQYEEVFQHTVADMIKNMSHQFMEESLLTGKSSQLEYQTTFIKLNLMVNELIRYLTYKNFYEDVGAHNMAFDEKNNEMIVFDVRR